MLLVRSGITHIPLYHTIPYHISVWYGEEIFLFYSRYFYGGLSTESDDVNEMLSKAVGADLRFNQPTDSGVSMQDMIKEMVQGTNLEQ